MTGPKPYATFITFWITNLPLILFYALVVPKIENKTEEGVVLAIMLTLNVIKDFFMIVTSVTNPGIIPKLEVDMSLLSRISRIRPASQKTMGIVNGKRIKLSFCSSCLIFRPPRTYHCYYWDNCVEVMDHHWRYISWWIGKRNYLYFMIFITSLTWIIGFAIAISFKVMVQAEGQFADVLRDNIPAIFIIIYYFAIGCFVVVLTFYHYVIILRGETTHENLKRIYNKKTNPFTRGIIHNVRMQLCPKKGENRMRHPYDMFAQKSFKFSKAAIDLLHVRSDKTFYVCKRPGASHKDTSSIMSLSNKLARFKRYIP